MTKENKSQTFENKMLKKYLILWRMKQLKNSGYYMTRNCIIHTGPL
jgi:hypothetical protein